MRDPNIYCCKCNKETFRPNQEDGWPEGWVWFPDGDKHACSDCRVQKKEYVSIKASERMKHYR